MSLHNPAYTNKSKTFEGVDRMTEVLLTVPEAARRLALGRTLVYSLIADGSLPSLKIGRARRIPASALERWVMAQVREELGQEAGEDTG
jgi:excisionase family DNA binding protein